jgi:membrane protein implicated in regulation of membrane protease activity
MRLVITYLLTLLLGCAIAFGVAWLVGLLLPAAKIPVFLILSVAWLWIGWRYAQAKDRGDV